MTAAPIERLMGMVSAEPTSGCWLWTGCVDRGGYARMNVEGRTVSAHRLAYGALRGPIPSGCDIDHLCRVRCCVNPWHMEPVSHRENVLRGNGVAARYAQSDRCRRGHLFTADNTTIRRDHYQRVCMKCARIHGGVDPDYEWRPVTHCPRGHAYDAVNTYYHRGKRYCKTCHAEGAAARYAARKVVR